jgi:hypothetical protein
VDRDAGGGARLPGRSQPSATAHRFSVWGYIEAKLRKVVSASNRSSVADVLAGRRFVSGPEFKSWPDRSSRCVGYPKKGRPYLDRGTGAHQGATARVRNVSAPPRGCSSPSAPAMYPPPCHGGSPSGQRRRAVQAPPAPGCRADVPGVVTDGRRRDGRTGHGSVRTCPGREWPPPGSLARGSATSNAAAEDTLDPSHPHSPVLSNGRLPAVVRSYGAGRGEVRSRRRRRLTWPERGPYAPVAIPSQRVPGEKPYQAGIGAIPRSQDALWRPARRMGMS